MLTLPPLHEIAQRAAHKYCVQSDGAIIRYATDNRTEADLVELLFHPFQRPSHVGNDPISFDIYSVVSSEAAQVLDSVRPTMVRCRLYGYEYGRVLTMNGFRDSETIRVIARETTGDATVYFPHNRSVYYMRRRTDPLDLLHVEQLIKYGMRLGASRSGLVNLHASAWITGNSGFAAVGDKGSGKSTLVMSMLAEGAKYISNDGVYIDHHHDSPATIISWPNLVRLGEATVDDSIVLRKLRSRTWLRRLHPALRPWIGPDQKIQFFHPLLDALFGCGDPVSTATLAGAIAPHLDPSLTACTITGEIPWASISSVVRNQPWASWLDPQDGESLAARDREMPAKLQGLPGPIGFEYGPAATSPARQLTEYLLTLAR